MNIHFLLLPLIVVSLMSCVRADSWTAPAVKVSASPDCSALLRVSPGRGEKSNATAAVLKYDSISGDYRKVVEFSLRNPVAPHDAVITNDARFIVTFDDWAELGRTENTVVVYRNTGEVVKTWNLADIFSDEERKKFTASVSSTWWRGNIELIENRAQSPIVIIRPETRMAPLDRSRKNGGVIVFDIVKMRFDKK